MATLTIRKFPEQNLARLKALAKRHNRSMEAEAREILTTVTMDRLLAMELIEKGWKNMRHGITSEEIVRSIREDRDR